MPIVFRQASEVAPGDPITSTQWNTLADACNSRLRSTLGDGPWRIAYYYYSLFRELFHSDQPTFPPSPISVVSQAQFFERWQQVEDANAHPWPGGPGGAPAPPGTAGGLATGQIMSGWINGISPDIRPEHERSNDVVTGPAGSPQSNWSRGKSQRGYRSADGRTDSANALIMSGTITQLTRLFSNKKITHQDACYGAYLDPEADGTPELQRTGGNTLRRALRSFVAEFRGTAGDLASDDYWNDEAADWQEVMTHQYYLAPALMDSGIVAGLYPRWRVQTTGTSVGAGTSLGQDHPTGTGHSQRDDYVSTHWLVRASGLAAGAKLKVDFTGGSYELAIPDDDGAIVRVATGCRKNLRVSLAADTDFNAGGGWIEAETNEILEMKPQIHDLYVIARMSQCKATGAPDGRGTTATTSKAMTDHYMATGMLRNFNAAAEIADNPGGLANQNSVFEAAREWSKSVRILDESALQAMEHDGTNTILWFRSDAPGTAGAKHFAGMEPIRATAPAKGQTNEWCMGVQLKPYGGTNQQLWDLFPKYYALMDRAHVGSADVWQNTTLRAQMQIDRPNVSGKAIAPEAPTMMRYTAKHKTGKETGSGYQWDRGWLNDSRNVSTDNKKRFYKSCRIYEPDLEIRSIETFAKGHTEPGDVKVTLKGRLHSTAGETADAAPGTYSADRSTWSWATLVAEANTNYRTLENGVRMYLMWQDAGGAKHAPRAWGDREMEEMANPITGDFAGIHGCIRPHFYFVKLLPKVYDDGNDDQDPHDTPLWADLMEQADAYLRAMCEGYLMRPRGDACDPDSYMIEWDYERLIRTATNAATDRTSPVPTVPTSYTPARDCRTDKPWGSALPNTYAAAEQFTTLARGYNLLRSVRLPFHATVEADFEHYKSANYTPTSGLHGRQCPDFPALATAIEGEVPSGAPIQSGQLHDPYNVQVVYQHRMEPAHCLAGNRYAVYSFESRAKIRIVEHDLFLAALPPDVRALYSTGAVGVSAYVDDENTHRVAHEADAANPPDPGWSWTGHDYWIEEIEEPVVPAYCQILPMNSWWTADKPTVLGNMGLEDKNGTPVEMGPDRIKRITVNPGHAFAITPQVA